MNCRKNNGSCNDDRQIYKEALEKIRRDQENLNFSNFVIIGPTGPTGPAGGATGPTDTYKSVSEYF